MAALKYSKQRASIKITYLLHTTAHPTADTVYLHIKKNFRISASEPSTAT